MIIHVYYYVYWFTIHTSHQYVHHYRKVLVQILHKHVFIHTSHHITSHYITLRCIALPCIALPCIALRYNAMQYHTMTLHYIHNWLVVWNIWILFQKMGLKPPTRKYDITLHT